MVGKSLDMRWGFLEVGTPHIEFWYPADIPANIVQIYHGIQSNVPNRQMTKTTLRTKSAGNEYNFRNVGHSKELMRVDIVLTTKVEARNFTDFFKYVIKGSSGIFYYKNNFNGQESYVRLVGKQLAMGEAEGAPYSYSLLLKKEAPYAIGRVNLKWNILTPVVILPFMVFKSSALYTSFILQPTNSMKMYATGTNSVGQYGNGTTSTNHVFTRIGTDIDWVDIGPGSNHTLAVKENGSLYVTGLNNKGQLGFGDITQRIMWTKLGTDSWISVAAGLNFSVAVKADGTLWAWGDNSSGQLGQGTVDSDLHTVPLQVGTDSNWVNVEANHNFVIVRKSDGTLWGFGDNSGGQLGQNFTSSTESTPLQIGTATNWSNLFTCGEDNAFGIKNNGWLYGWGNNSYGALGIGDGVNNTVLTPQWVSGLWQSVGSGINGSSAVKIDGTLWTWGNNASGQLGQGTSDSGWHSSPVQVGVDTDWAVTAYSRNSVLAVKDDETVYGWGANLFGSLGLGHTSTVLSPTLTFKAPTNKIDLRWDIVSPPGNEISLKWDIEGPVPSGNEISLKWNILFAPPPP